MNDPQLHHRQFVLGPEPVLAGEGWISDEITPSLFLSRCVDLPSELVTDARGSRWHLLGSALQSAPERPSPTEDLASNDSTSLLDVYGSWFGRWILVGESELHLDACGLLGCFYRTVERGPTKELWASSSPALLANLPGRPPLSAKAPRLHWAKGMEWYPPPRSRFPGVSRLLPTQVLSLRPESRGSVSPRPPLIDVVPPESYEGALEGLERILVTAMGSLRERPEELWLSLTGGLDSRLMLAAAHQAGLPLTTFTHRYRLMPTGDRILPPLVAGEVGFEHRFVGPTGFSRQRRAKFDAHTAGHCVELDRVFYARGMWSALPPRAVILRGGVFEVARCYYYRKLPDPAPGDLFEHISRQFHLREFHPDSSAHFEGIAEWTEWVARTPCPGLDWRDRFYLEQRLGGWESSIEQALDLTTYDRLYPANSHLYISTALALAEGVRRSGRHHVDLIRRMAPELLRLPSNPPDDLPVRLWSGARNEWQQFSARRRKAGYAVYVARRGFRMAKRLVKKAD